jgi:hypothetical protein
MQGAGLYLGKRRDIGRTAAYSDLEVLDLVTLVTG